MAPKLNLNELYATPICSPEVWTTWKERKDRNDDSKPCIFFLPKAGLWMAQHAVHFGRVCLNFGG